jgi:acyl-[acyl-carrier-protein]-phospholipid O-acyltransferase/long-chain-fatty-acid--[acyl-carrier-protein] ligase
VLQTKEAVLEAIAPIGWLLVIGSTIEWYLASKLPNKMIEASQRNFKFKRYIKGVYLLKNFKTIQRKKEVFEAIISLGLFWSISQVILAIFGEYAKSELGVTNTIFVQGVMALAGIGIVIGSIAAARYSKYFINLGLTPIGAIGITILVFLIPFVHSMSIMAIMFTTFGIFSGFLMVPLNAQIQFLSPRVHLGTVIAGSNFVQNIFMFLFLMITTLFAYFGMNSELLFFIMSATGIYLFFLTFRKYGIDMFWAVMEIFSTPRHVYKYEGLENIPKNGAVLLMGNHVSWLDWIIVQLPLKRRINFMMEKEIYYWFGFHFFFAVGKAIPVSVKASKDAFYEVYQRLLQGEIVGIFPEGAITKDGKLSKFHRGYELINSEYKGVIIPYFIDGIFGSSFSKYKGRGKRNLFKRREIRVYFGEAISNKTKTNELKEIIQKMKERYGQ